MQRKEFQDVITELKKVDTLTAECILSSLDGVSIAFRRELTEDEKMIAYSMFMSGIIYEVFSQDNDKNTISSFSRN